MATFVFVAGGTPQPDDPTFPTNDGARSHSGDGKSAGDFQEAVARFLDGRGRPGVTSYAFTYRSWLLVVGIAEVDDRAEPVSVEVLSCDRNGRIKPLTASGLRLPFGEAIAEARSIHASTVSQLANPLPPAKAPPKWLREHHQRMGIAEREIAEREKAAAAARAMRRTWEPKVAPALRGRVGRPPKYDDAHFARVADIYLNTWKNGLDPTKAVADELGGTRSQAAKWVAEARRRKLLPPALGKGKAGMKQPRRRKGGMRDGSRST